MRKVLKIGNVFDNKIILFCDGKMLFYYNRNNKKYEWEKTNVDKLLKILFSDLEEIPFNEISKELTTDVLYNSTKQCANDIKYDNFIWYADLNSIDIFNIPDNFQIYCNKYDIIASRIILEINKVLPLTFMTNKESCNI